MNKAILLPVRPNQCELIVSGKISIIVRKTKPKINTSFKCYMYCTLSGSMDFLKNMTQTIGDYDALCKWNKENWGIKKGKIIGEFICDKIIGTEYYVREMKDATSWRDCYEGYDSDFVYADGHCLTIDELYNYGNKKFLYSWYISNLIIYNIPKELKSFNSPCLQKMYCENCHYSINNDLPFGEISIGCERAIKRPPRSWCYVEELENDR